MLQALVSNLPDDGSKSMPLAHCRGLASGQGHIIAD